MQKNNRNRQPRIPRKRNATTHGNDEPISPYEQAFKKKPTDTLVPFGIGVLVLNDERAVSEKFEARAYEAVVIGYASNGAYRTVNVKQMRETGKVRIVTTRDVRFMGNTFPAHKYNFDSTVEFGFSGTQDTENKCGLCDKFLVGIEETPICRGCIEGKTQARTHAKDATCKRNWCTCPKTDATDPPDDFDDGETNVRTIGNIIRDNRNASEANGGTAEEILEDFLEDLITNPTETTEGLLDAPTADRPPRRRYSVKQPPRESDRHEAGSQTESAQSGGGTQTDRTT